MHQPGPKKIATLFETYKKNLHAPEATVIATACEVIADLCEVSILPKQLSYTPATRVIHIKNGLLRSAILPHKTEVITHLTGRLGTKSTPVDIV